MMILLAGCATSKNLVSNEFGYPGFYSGTRLNLAALNQDYSQLDEFARKGIQPPAYPAIDLPFSLVGDTVTFASLTALYIVSHQGGFGYGGFPPPAE